MPKIIIDPSGTTFPCEGRQSILEAALAASVALNYGCSSGTCGLCIGRLKQGKIEKIRHYDFPVKDADRLRGDFPLCSYTAASPEVIIEAAEATGGIDIPWQRIEARIKKLERISNAIGVIAVQTPRTSRLRFLPGQNACLTLPVGLSADMPIASCPCDDRNIEFHLRNDPSDEFAGAVFGTTTFPTPVRIEGPWGPTPEMASNKRTVCLAYDTYIAPLRSWIEQQLAEDSSQMISVYWCARDESDFYLANLLNAWRDAFDAFSFYLIVTDDPARIPSAVKNRLTEEEISPAGDVQVLISGPAPFTNQVRTILESINFPESSQYVHTMARPT